MTAESVRLGFGTLPLSTSATGHTTTTISLADGDGAPSDIADDIAVSFGASSYTATEGETDASVTVTLSAAPSTAVNIPNNTGLPQRRRHRRRPLDLTGHCVLHDVGHQQDFYDYRRGRH